MAPGAPSGQQRPETSVAAVVVDQGRLLLIRRGRGPAEGRWSIPGGRVEWGESLRAAVEREVAEETGLRVACGPFIDFTELIGASSHFVLLDFWAEVVGDPSPLVAGDDAADAAWVALADLAHLDLVDGLLAFLIDHGIAAPAVPS